MIASFFKIVSRNVCLNATILLLTFYSSTTLRAQGEFPSGVAPVGTSALRGYIRTILKGDSTDWWKALHTYFGEAYDTRLPDLVIFIDSSENVRASMISGNGSITTLYGQEKLWVVIFSEKDYPDKIDTEKVRTQMLETKKLPANLNRDTVSSANGKSKEPTDPTNGITTTIESKVVTNTFTVKRETLRRTIGPQSKTIMALIETVVGAISSAKPSHSDDVNAMKDSETTVSLKSFGTLKDSLDQPLYVGVVEVDLGLNTYHRIVVRPSQSNTFRHYDYGFINAENTYFSSSIGFGLRGDFRHPKISVQPSFLLLGEYNFTRLRLPLYPYSYAFACGISVVELKDLKINFFLGGRTSLSYLGSAFGDGGLLIGITIGANTSPMPTLGLDVRF